MHSSPTSIDDGIATDARRHRSRELSPAVVESIDEPRRLFPLVSRTRRWVALLQPVKWATVEALSRPFATVARTMIDKASHGPGAWYGLRFDALSLLDVPTGCSVRVPLDERWELWPIGFSADDRYFAFVTIEPLRVTLRWIDCRGPGTVHHVEPRLNGTGIIREVPLGSWVGATHRLLVVLVDEEHEARMAAAAPPAAPAIYDTTDAGCEPEMLRLLADEQPFALRRYLRSQLAIVDVEAAAVTRVAEPALWDSASASPDGRYVLLREFTNPDEPATEWRELTRRVLVKELDSGRTIRQLWSPCAREPEPHYRACRWHPLQPSTVAWLQATSTGDRVWTLPAPFRGEPRPLLDVAGHGVAIDWTTTGRFIVTTARSRGELQFLADNGRTVCGESRPSGDEASSPAESSLALLSPWTAGPSERVLLEIDGQILVTGHRHQDNRVVPFLDAIGMRDGARTRILGDAPAEQYERALAPLSGDASVVLTSIESPREPPRLCIFDARTGARTLLGGTVLPSPLAGVVRRRLSYTGTDGAERDVNLYLPPGARAGEPLPFIVWIDPSLGRVSGIPANRYPAVTWLSPVFLALEGYGVVESAPLQFVPSSETAVGDLVADVEALVEGLVNAGMADRRRIALGGYCAGGWMATLLLASCDAFAAGISCGGFFNLTAIAPDRDVTGRIPVWNDPRRYSERSPLMNVQRVHAPLLLIHGAREESPVHQRTQSLAMFVALHGAGKTARYVRLPFEKHLYRARANILLVLSEILRWCDAHV